MCLRQPKKITENETHKMPDILPTIIVPARLASVRFPKKLLQEIKGLPLIIHTANRLKEVASEFEIIFAVDGVELEEVLVEYGFETIRTDPNLSSGTDRIAQANLKLSKSEILNIQADEPMVQREHILALVEGLKQGKASMTTLATPFHEKIDFEDKNQVKVVLDQEGFALYFSRLPIPGCRDSRGLDDFSDSGVLPLKHLGLYGYTAAFLKKFTQSAQGGLEKLEKLEQLRALEMGESIAVSIVSSGTIGVDVPADLEKLKL